MTTEEIEATKMSNHPIINILGKAKKGKSINLKEFLMLYIDDMEADSTLLKWCKNDRERTLAYAVIALNSRIMNDADPIIAYNTFTEANPITESEFDKIKVELGFKGYEPMSEEDEKEWEKDMAEHLESMKAKELSVKSK